MKLPPSLDRIEYLSIYGGRDLDDGRDVVVDGSGRAYVSGRTFSDDLPGMTGGFQSDYPGGGSGFIARISTDGSRVEAASSTPGVGLALDPDGMVYVTGIAPIGSIPLVNAARTAKSPLPGDYVGFLMKLDPDLRKAVYSTSLGAEASFLGQMTVTADSEGRAYVLRNTGPIDPATGAGGRHFGGSEETAIETFSAEGVPEGVLYFDDAEAIALDAHDQLVVAGERGFSGLVPGRSVRRGSEPGETALRPQVPAAYLARVGPEQPLPYVEAVVNAASFRTGPAAPGVLVSLFGRDLGPDPGAAFELADGRLPVDLGDTQVLFGETPAPMLLSGTGQLNAASPFSLQPGELIPIQVRRDGAASNRIWLTVAGANPGIFTQQGAKIGDGAILNQDGTINAPFNPAKPGSIIAIFATGGGILNPPLQADEVTGLALSHVPQTIQIEFDRRVPGEITYAGSAPGLIAGVLQVNVVVPSFGPDFVIVDVSITVGEAQSGPFQAFVSIQP